MERQSKEPRGLEAYCSGDQGPPRAVAPSGRITGIWSLSPLIGVKIIHLVDRTDLFKISNFVYGGREFVTSLYSSLEGQREFMACIVS